MSGKGWTVEREALLRRRWAQGHSATPIARELNCGMTRDAVLGKLNQLGLIGDRKPSQPGARKATAGSAAKAARPKTTRTQPPPEPDPRKRKVTGEVRLPPDAPEPVAAPAAPSGGARPGMDPRLPAMARMGLSVAEMVRRTGMKPDRVRLEIVRLGLARPAPQLDAPSLIDRVGPDRPYEMMAGDHGVARVGGPRRLLALQRGDCRWPVGRDAREHVFCGEPCAPGSPYCDDHHRRAYRARPADGEGEEAAS